MIAALSISIGLSLLFGGLWYVAHRQRSALRAKLEQLREAAWCQWWTRNAAEMTRADPSRLYLVGLAYAAQLAPSMRVFLEDLEDLTREPNIAEGLKNAAKSFAQELRAERRPWDVWEETGAPMHARGALDQAYREALQHLICRIPITSRLAEHPKQAQ